MKPDEAPELYLHTGTPEFRGHLRNCHHLSWAARLSIRKLGMSSIDSADKADSETHEIGRSTGTGGGHSDGVCEEKGISGSLPKNPQKSQKSHDSKKFSKNPQKPQKPQNPQNPQFPKN